MSVRTRREKVGVVSTTDGTTVTTIITSDTLPDNASFRSELTLVGRDASNNSVACKVATRGKTAAGAATIEGSLSTIEGMTGNALLIASVPTMTASGATVLGRVVGIAATTIEWTGWLETHIN